MARYLGFKASTKETDYYFVSYNSKDELRVGLLAKQISDAGIDLWYDDAIPYGSKWEEAIGLKIANSRAVIFFFTKGMLAKEDSYAIKEYRMATKQGKKVYIFLVDEVRDEYWKLYPKKSSFLDDLNQKHFPDTSINALINRLKQDDNLEINEVEVEQEHKKFFIEGPVILDSEYLLNNGYMSAHEISRRHVELDYLATDKELFPDALDVEGDADTWKDMITATAECSANLIINSEIVAYMDFLPVTPANYDFLKTNPFDDSYVEIAFGGRFDIFGSMFSFDPNYATPNNYLLFVKWMIDRIVSWKENGVIIGKIEFCIYNKNQGKALESLGFKLITHNKLKGWLYEIKVMDLLANKLIRNRFGGPEIKSLEYKVAGPEDNDVINQCLDIAESLHEKHGGILQYENAPKESDVLFYCQLKDEVIGYLGLKKYDALPDGIYIEQIAIKPERQGLGVGKKLIKIAIDYAKDNGYKALYANCKKSNELSHKVFNDSKFFEFEMSEETYLNIGINKSDIPKNIALKYIIE